MPIGVAKVEGLDAAGVFVPVGQPLRTSRSMFHFVLTQPGISLLHVARDDCDVLKPTIVAASIDGKRASFRSEVFGQLDELIAQPHSHYAHAHSEKTLQVLVIIADHFNVGNFFE